MFCKDEDRIKLASLDDGIETRQVRGNVCALAFRRRGRWKVDKWGRGSGFCER